MLRILLVSDNAHLISVIERALRGSGIDLVGVARSPADALDRARRLKPDLVVVSVRMARLDGVSLVKEIMIVAPTPIVVVAQQTDPELASGAADALESGALAIIAAPLEREEGVEEGSSRKFLSSIAAMAQVKVVRRWRDRSGSAGLHRIVQPDARIVGIAASTGGPAAIKKILEALPPHFPAPILVVQHISHGHIDALATALDETLPFRVKVAQDGDMLSPGTVYFAPDDRQMGVLGRSRIAIADDPPVEGFRPSGSYLFTSIAQAFDRQAVAVVLTGMGRDGTEGVRSIRAANGMVLAQDDESSVVFGMPKAAIDSGFVDLVVPLSRMAHEIARLTSARQE